MNSQRYSAAVLPAPQAPITVTSLEVNPLRAGEVLVRMEACGVCHSDLFIAGLDKLAVAPVTLGHEGIGRVEAAGPGVRDWAAGDRVAITYLGTTCGACEWCLSGRRRFCPNQTNFGYTLPGALAQYVAAPASALVRAPDGIAAEQAAPL